MFLDVLIVLVLAVAAYVGFQRGLLPPLLSEVFFVLAVLLLLRFGGPFSGLVDHFLPRNLILHLVLGFLVALAAGFVGGRLGRMLQRMPVVRGVDGFLGVFVHVLIAVAVLYVFISALVAMDVAFAPLVRAATLTANQAQVLRHSLDSNPLTAAVLGDGEAGRLQRDAGRHRVASIEDYPLLNQFQTVYLGFLRSQLHGSRLAPLILRIGSHLPLVRHLGSPAIPKTG